MTDPGGPERRQNEELPSGNEALINEATRILTQYFALTQDFEIDDPEDEHPETRGIRSYFTRFGWSLHRMVEYFRGEPRWLARVPRTRLNVKLGGARGLQLTIATALLSDIATHDPHIGTAVGLAAAALDRVRILKDEDLEVFEVMQKLSFGQIYRVWLNEDEVISELSTDDTDTYIDSQRRTLANMKSRGILEESAGQWRAVW